MKKITAVFLLVIFPVYLFAGLDSAGGNTDHINQGSGSSLDNIAQGTFILWVDLDAIPASFESFSSKGGTGGLSTPSLSHTGNVGAGMLQISAGRATDGQSASSVASVLTTGFQIIAGTWDITNGGPRVYRGTLTTIIVDVTNTSVDGAGAQNDDSAFDLFVWNSEESGFDTISPNGRLSRCMIFNTDLSLNQIRGQQFMPHNTANTVLWVEYGYNGTGTQPDWSGNGNSGAVTGLTQSDHIPLAPSFGFDRYVMDIAPPSAARRRTLIFDGGGK